MAGLSAFGQHIDTEKLTQTAANMRTLKADMDNKISEIEAQLNKLESDYAYSSPESEQIRQAFSTFRQTTQTEFDKDMEAFASFFDKVVTTHGEVAGKISTNISNLSNETSGIASQFNS